MLLMLSVAFVGNAVRALQEADKIAVTPVVVEPGPAADLRGRADRHPPDPARASSPRLCCSLIYVLGMPLRVRLAAARGGPPPAGVTE